METRDYQRERRHDMKKMTPAKKNDGRAGLLPAVYASKCNSCYSCVEACPRKAILIPVNTTCAKCVKYCLTMEVPCSPELVVFSYDLCDGCGICVDACPHGAIYWFGRGTVTR